MLVENFEEFVNKCFKTFYDKCEVVIKHLNSQQINSQEIFLNKFEDCIKDLYVLEKHAKSKIYRKVHQIVLCLNSLVIQYLAKKNIKKRSNQREKMETLITRFKSLIKTVDSCIIRFLKDSRMGSVEILYTRLLSHKFEMEDFKFESLIKMLKECVQGDFEFTIDTLYETRNKKLKKKSNSGFMRKYKSKREPQLLNNYFENNFLDYSKNRMNSYNSLVQADELFLDHSEFYDASIVILRNFLQMNKILLTHFVPGLF